MTTVAEEPAPNSISRDMGANDIDYLKALGADDGGLVDTAVNAVKGLAGKVADKLDPLTEIGRAHV